MCFKEMHVAITVATVLSCFSPTMHAAETMADVTAAQAARLETKLAQQEERSGSEHADVGFTLNELAILYFRQRHYDRAESLFKRSLAIGEKALGPEHREIAARLHNMATLYDSQGRFDEAEPLFKRSLAILEKVRGFEHRDVALSLNNLANLYRSQGRFADAELFFKRSLAIAEDKLGPESLQVATTLGNLAWLYNYFGRYSEAEATVKRSLAIWEKKLGPEHPDVGFSLNILGGIYANMGRYADAEPVLKRGLEIREKQLNPESVVVGAGLVDLAILYQHQGRFDEAELLFKRALSIEEKSRPNTLGAAGKLFQLVQFYTVQGRYADALPYSHKAFEIIRTRFVGQNGDSAGMQSLRLLAKKIGIEHVMLLAKRSQQIPAQRSGMVNEAFEASQLALSSNTGEVVAKMAARFATGSDALAQIARERQDKIVRLQKLDADLLRAVSLEAAKRDSTREKELRNDIATVSRQLTQFDKELAANFPEYAELTAPKPLNLSEAEKLLSSQEALLAYTVADKASYLFVLRADKAELIELDIRANDLNGAVQHLRERLDPSKNGDLLPFDAQASHELYRKIFAPAEPYLAGVKNVTLVLDGALQSLPFGVLIHELPKSKLAKPADHSQLAWIAKRYAFTTVPSISSLRALRTFAKRDVGAQPFVGFGDPVLEGGIGKDKSIKLGSVFTTRRIADVDILRKADRLPETADELKAIAQTLKASEKELYLQERATETVVKSMDLSNFRTIAFSTHGVMAGELKGLNEPGLVLSPPRAGTEQDDGYLSASEIAQLKLNADWVVLSACNTAAPDGTPGAEGLSGLAKAFFYAGARSLLVSHWPVDSEATKELQIGLLQEYAKNPVAGKAEALRLATLNVMRTAKHPEFAHPLFWAPFVVAGEGGAVARQGHK